jgi:uncharacterized membrane protein (DUF485 family)
METNNPSSDRSTETEQSQRIAKQKARQITLMKSLSLSIQFGLMIVIPLLVFAYAGKWLSARYHSQIYFYLGLILALASSAIWFYKRISDLYKDFID